MASVAAAGMITVVTFDEIPSELEAGETYTFGYSFMAHGEEPMDIGGTSLRFHGPDGQVLSFTGVTIEKGRVTADVVIPEAGDWRWEVVSGDHVFRDLGSLPVGAASGPVSPSSLLTALRIVLPIAASLAIMALLTQVGRPRRTPIPSRTADVV
jgi:hypothetical protein